MAGKLGSSGLNNALVSVFYLFDINRLFLIQRNTLHFATKHVHESRDFYKFYKNQQQGFFMHSVSSTTAVRSEQKTNGYGKTFFNSLHKTSERHDGKASRLFSRNYLRQDFSRLYHDVKDGKLQQDGKFEVVNKVFQFFETETVDGREKFETTKVAVAHLDTLKKALAKNDFKNEKNGIAQINDAVAKFSQFLYRPGKKSAQEISESTQAFFSSLLTVSEITPEKNNALCDMIDAATTLANMEMLLPADREEAINKFTSSAETFINAIFGNIEVPEEHNHAKAIFKDAVFLAVLNAGLLMCYEQKSGLNKFRLLVKRSFVPFAYVCTKAEGIAAGFLTTKVGAAMGAAISGALSSTVGKVGIGALAIKFSVPTIFFVGSGALGLAITYALYRASEKSANDLKKNLDDKIKNKRTDLKNKFNIDDSTIEQKQSSDLEDIENSGDILTALKNRIGDNGNLTSAQKSQNPTINPVRTGNGNVADHLAGIKQKGLFRSSGRVAKDLYKAMEGRIDTLKIAFNNSTHLDTYITNFSRSHPVKAYETALEGAKKLKSNSKKAAEIQKASKTFLEGIVNIDSKENPDQKLKIGEMLALFHQYINESDRYTIADLSKRTTDLYNLAGEIAQTAIDSSAEDTGENKADLVSYLQFQIYSAGFALAANHRSLADKSKRYASILIAPACNSLLKVETMGVAAVSQMLVEPHITNAFLQVGIDSFASVALGVPFVAMGIALGAWTLVKADNADAKGIKTVNPLIRDYVKAHLEKEQACLKQLNNSLNEESIKYLMNARKLEETTAMLNQIAATENVEFLKKQQNHA